MRELGYTESESYSIDIHGQDFVGSPLWGVNDADTRSAVFYPHHEIYGETIIEAITLTLTPK